MRISSVVIIVAAVALAACETDRSPQIAGLTPTTGASSGASALAITPASARITIGSSLQLATNAPAALQSQVEWASLTPSVATVSQTGLVTAGAAGTATVRARFSSDTTNTTTAIITVVPLTGTP